MVSESPVESRSRLDLLRSAIVWPRAALGGHRRATAAGQTVLVTGASSGIGRATATLLGSHGATVIVLARSADRLAAVVDEINAAGGEARSLRCDLAERADVDAALAELADVRLDIVISNAGISIHRPIARTGERDDLGRSLAVNVDGPARLLMGVVPAMIERGGGTLVNVSTVSAKPPPAPKWGTYQASKSAFDIWLRSAAVEWRSAGVDVRTVYMPLVTTPMSESGGLYANAPALRVNEAARIVVGAAVGGRNRIAPWWLVWQDLAATLLPSWFDAGFARHLSHQRDAKGRQPEHRHSEHRHSAHRQPERQRPEQRQPGPT